MDDNALESAAGQVSGIAGNFGSELAALGALVQSTRDFWESPAQVAFEAKYEQFKATMTQFIEALNEYSKAMRQNVEDERNSIARGVQRIDSI